MYTGRYSFIEILEFKNLDQFVIPEVQRDYVWQISDVKDILEYIADGFQTADSDVPYLGFIYAYNDKDYVHKYFLVDGQQRLTTLYLLLLALYRKMKKKLPEYLIYARNPKIDYKVRQATHDFLTDFISHDIISSEKGDCAIKNQVWYHAEYSNDPTIKNMICNYEYMTSWLERFSLEEIPKFIKYVEDTVDISYFDIDDGRQGEDLYIYMNSRGRQLEANETFKASFLSLVATSDERVKWGKDWEDWQDFFWKHRNAKKHPDADAGFNEFLKMVQIINMCNSGMTGNEIIKFASEKSTKSLSVQLVASSLEELQTYFESYEWLVESELFNNFFKKYETSENYFSPGKEWKLIDYFRVLPIINLIARTRTKDELAVLRFLRFFYNVSRKRDIGKDVASQLPIAIKLTSEYASDKKDAIEVCDLINYQKGRTTLIDTEEEIKLKLIYDYHKNDKRNEIEALLWTAEDHFIFDGVILPLLRRNFTAEEQFLEDKFRDSLNVIKLLFVNNATLNAQISRALLYYGNTWIQDSPYYYTNYNCQDWPSIVEGRPGRYFFKFISDMHGKQTDYMDVIIRERIKSFFTDNEINSIEAIKSQENLFNQMRVLVAIDYYTNRVIWRTGAYIAQDERYSWKDYTPFFNKDRVIYNISRYVKDGYQNKIISEMKTVLQNDDILNEVIAKIFKGQP